MQGCGIHVFKPKVHQFSNSFMCSFFMAAAGRANGLSTCCFFAFDAEPPPSLLFRGAIPGPKPKDGHLARAPSKGVV